MKIFCMKVLYSLAIASWMKESIAMKPLGERSVLEEMLRRKAMTVSPILMVLTLAMRSLFLP